MVRAAGPGRMGRGGPGWAALVGCGEAEHRVAFEARWGGVS